MSSPEFRTKRHKAFRKRIRKFLQVPFAAKQFAWRLTAGWFWICAFATIFRFREHLNTWGEAIFSELSGALTNLGFAPSNLKVFSIGVKLLWLFTICGFSWIQVIGFFLYVPLLPLLIMRFALRKRLRLEPYRKIREETFKASRKSGDPAPKRTWGFPLFCLLLLWSVLYGQTSAPYPLFLALVLTALLFCSRVGRALTFAVPAENRRWIRIESMSAGARKFVARTSETLKTGQIFEKWQLNVAIWTGSFILRTFRVLSRLLHGKTARRRTALVVLLRFMLNLAALGAISILFWALAIKFVLAPMHVSLLEALLASASSAIPGIPGPSTMKVPAVIQTFDSLTAWLVFVLYAGPVASLFPDFQKQAIERSAANYARLRDERKKMRRILEPLRSLQKLFRENPNLTDIAKAAKQLSALSEADVRQAFLGQPAAVRALASNPVLTDFMRKLGAPIPNLEELTQELPPTPVDTGAPVEVKPEANQPTAQDNVSTEEPGTNGKEGV